MGAKPTSPARYAAAIAALFSCAFADPTSVSACGSTLLGETRVTTIENSHTLLLADGRRLKLAGIQWSGTEAARLAALRELMLDQAVSLKGDATPDRYGRIYAFPSISGSETAIQYALLERGLALANGSPGDKACALALLAAEKTARQARAGVWADLRPLAAGEPAVVLKERGRFAVVEGKVLSVRESGNTIYVNFGRRWSEDFTVTIAKRRQSAFISGGLDPRSLSGRVVQVRGFVEGRAGPGMEATGPEQFELAASQ